MTVASSGGSSGTTLYALSQATGATVWSQPISGTYHLSNAAYDSGQVFVVNFDGLLRAFDADTGTLNWSVQLAGGQYAFNSPPTASGGNVYVTGSGYGSTLYAVSETMAPCSGARRSAMQTTLRLRLVVNPCSCLTRADSCTPTGWLPGSSNG